MNKFWKIAVLLGIVMLTTACPGWYSHYLINGVELTPMKVGKYHYIETKSFQTDIIFKLGCKTDIVAQARAGFSLIQECRATTKGIKWDNRLVRESYELSFDKYIVYNGVTIHANENLLTSALKDKITVVQEDTNDRGFSDFITFETGIVNALTFESKNFTARFRCKTTDNRNLEASTPVVIE